MSRRPIELKLSTSEKEKLEALRTRDQRPYRRERAAALLKTAGGESGLPGALQGLLRPRTPRTGYQWGRRYQAEGSEGLEIRAGRGRKPAFPP